MRKHLPYELQNRKKQNEQPRVAEGPSPSQRIAGVLLLLLLLMIIMFFILQLAAVVVGRHDEQFR